MTPIILEIDDDAHAALMMEVLAALTFVRTVKAIPAPLSGAEEAAVSGDFFSLTGIWEGRDVSKECLRQRAWPEHPR